MRNKNRDQEKKGMNNKQEQSHHQIFEQSKKLLKRWVLAGSLLLSVKNLSLRQRPCEKTKARISQLEAAIITLWSQKMGEERTPDFIRIKANPTDVNLLETKCVYYSECFWLQVTKSKNMLAYTIRNCIISQNWKFKGKADQVQYNQQFSEVIKGSGFFSLCSAVF